MDKGSRNGGEKLFVGAPALQIYLSKFYELHNSYELQSLGPKNFWHLSHQAFGRECIEDHKRFYHVISNKPDKALEKEIFYDLIGILSSGNRFESERLVFSFERRFPLDEGFEESPQQQWKDFKLQHEQMYSDSFDTEELEILTFEASIALIDRYSRDNDGQNMRKWLNSEEGWTFNMLPYHFRVAAVHPLKMVYLEACGSNSPLGGLVERWLHLFNCITFNGRGYDIEAESVCAMSSMDDWSNEAANDAVKTVIAAVLLRFVYNARYEFVKDNHRVCVLALMAAMLYGNRVEVNIQPVGPIGKLCVFLMSAPRHQLIGSFLACCRLYPILGVSPSILDMDVRIELLDYVTIDTFWIYRQVFEGVDVVDLLRHILCEHQLRALI